ncbi:hypothetical protein CYMTET_51147 [Cymbomonas tetramitiformis]|uniref:Uncharacterized protein n=1 Tax=Cymbomonas tetramitiformis TaxID=36881 RepID=A0AAE0BMW9_9CHLO|nr:hypothetical protein CYMTET_51147 [Cymbomonas tetramitiformis]
MRNIGATLRNPRKKYRRFEKKSWELCNLSACSFCEEGGEVLVSAVTEFSEMARTAGASTFNINTFTADLPVVSEPTAHSPPASVESEEGWTGPPNPFCPPVTRTFADFIESTGIAFGAPDEPAASMNLLSAVEAPERVMDYKPATYATSDDDDEDASVAPPRPRYGCGDAIPGFGRSLLTSSLVCALFVICATAAPHTVADVGGAGARTCTAPPVGGATWTASAVPTTGTSPTAMVRDDLGDAVGGASTAAIPPHRQARYRELRQGFHTLRNVPRPPWLYDPDPDYVPPSPPYPPPPYSSDDEEPSSGDHAAVIEDSTISSKNNLPPAPEAGNYFTLTLLRAGSPAPQTPSG